MKKILLFVMMVMCVGITHAQWSVAPEVGMTAVKRESSEWKSGIKAGIAVEYNTGPLFSLKSGLYYTKRGYKLEPYMDIVPNPYKGDQTSTGESILGEKDLIQISGGETKRHFLQIPLLANFHYQTKNDIRINVALGPYIAYSIHDNSTYYMMTLLDRGEGYWGPNSAQWGNPGDLGFEGYHESDDYGDYSPFSGIKKFDWGTTAEIGLDIKNWVMKVGYDLSLGKEYDDDKIGPNYHTISFTAAYKFKW